ncbi:MAG: serine/threonine protein kinase [Deltaproteobacteria bacterium]|nr:serine/threonine protein kinase [Deltaproteobacteria bacterium]
MSEQNPQMLGRYQLLALLATGGMAEIYLARQTGIGGFQKLVVVKKILPHLARDERFVEMFFDEARIAAQLNHPNVVQIYDLGKADDDYFIAMEYLEGESLGFLVKASYEAKQILTPALSAGIIAQVCDGLHFAHHFLDETGQPQNIVHRDVSPHNVIAMFNGVVKLVDFGIAKAASQMHQTRIGTLKGKLTYMSPEQCRGKPVDGRSDIFCLGVVFWELLTRKRLFKRESEPAIITAIIVDEIPHVLDVKPDIPKDLAAIAMKALEKNAGNRFQTAGDMSQALREWLRKNNKVAGTHEIAAFMKAVFADRARTKQKLLEEIKSSGADGVSLGVLKPETSESVPSASRASLSGELQKSDLHHAATGVRAEQPKASPAQTVEDMPVAEAPNVDLGSATILRDPAEFEDEAPADKEQALGSQANKKTSMALWLGVPFILICLVVAGYLFWSMGLESSNPDPSKPTPLLSTDAGTSIHADAVLVAEAPKPEPPKPEPPKPEPPKPEPPKPEPPKPEPPKPEFAIFKVSSKPAGCKVTVDGKALSGTTPIKELKLPADKSHKVTVRCAGHRKEVKRAKAAAGEKVALAFSPRKLTRKPPRPKARKMGKLRIKTKPWSEIYLGKKKLGITPLLGVELPAGTHTLTAINKARKLKKTIRVTILPGKTTTVKRNLE